MSAKGTAGVKKPRMELKYSVVERVADVERSSHRPLCRWAWAIMIMRKRMLKPIMTIEPLSQIIPAAEIMPCR